MWLGCHDVVFLDTGRSSHSNTEESILVSKSNGQCISIESLLVKNVYTPEGDVSRFHVVFGNETIGLV